MLFTLIILATTVSVAYSLNLFDNIVNSTLYNYGLQFSYDWASPYWTILRTIQALLGLTAVFTVTNMIYVYRKYIHVKPETPKPKMPKPEMKITVSEKPAEKLIERPTVPMPAPTPATTLAPAPATETQPPSASGLVKCAHCGKVFAQPLRMLDFHDDRPRMINICPFCNEVIQPVFHQDESERAKKARQETPKKEVKETVSAHP